MLDKNLLTLLEKEIVTLKELEEIEQHEQVTNVEDCGMSGKYVGKHWYVITTEDQEEYNIYC